MEIDGVLLAGGAGRRMGRDKSALPVGGQSFAERIALELAGFGNRFLSVATGDGPSLEGFVVVRDIYPNRGPIGGLHAVLRACRSDGVLAVACDMPCYRKGLGAYLIGQLTADIDVVVPVTRDGRMHPLCAVYRRQVADVLEQQILAGKLSLLSALGHVRLRTVALAGTEYPDEMLSNINTPEEYEALLQRMQGGIS